MVKGTSPEDARVDAVHGWVWVVVVASWALVATVLPVIGLGVLGPVLVDDGVLLAADIGLLAGLFHLGGTASPILAGRLVDAVGSRRTLVVAAAVTTVAMGALQLSTGRLPWAPWMLAAGCAFGAANPTTNRLIGDALRGTRKLGLGTGIKQSGVPVASIVAGLGLLPLASALGWRWAYLGMAAVPALLGVAVVASTPARATAETPGETVSPRRGAAPRLWMLVVFGMLMGAGMTAFSAYLALFLASGHYTALDEYTAGRALAVAGVAGIASRILVASRVDPRSAAAYFPFYAAGSAAAVGLLLATELVTPLLVWPAVILGGLSIYGWTGVYHLALVTAGRPDEVGTVSGKALTGFGVGLMVGGPVFGLVLAAVSFEAAWMLTGTMFVIAAIVASKGQPSFGDRRGKSAP